MNVVRANPSNIRSTRRSSASEPQSSLVPIAVVAGTAIVVFGVVYYLGRRRAQTSLPTSSQSHMQLPPGATAINEFGYPVGYDGTPKIGRAHV